MNFEDIKTLIQLGEFEDAKELCISMLQAHPNNQDLLFYLAQSHSVLREHTLSIEVFKKLVYLDPKSPDNYSNLAVELLKNNQANQALNNLQISLKLDPNSACSHFNLGNTYQYLNDFNNTVKHYKQATKLNKLYSKAHSNLGAFFLKHQHLSKSLNCLLKSIDIDPNCPTTLLNISNVYRELNQEEKSIDYAVRACQIAPNDVEILSNYNHITMSTCLWNDTQTTWQNLDSLNSAYIEQNIPLIEPPFLNIARVDDPSINYKVANHTSKSLQCENIRFRVIPLPKNGQPIKVGYISGDFKNHPVGQAVVNLFSKHSKQIEAYAISFGEEDNSHIRAKIKSSSFYFLDISQDSNLEAAKKINDLKLHILIDLSGHTKRNRMEVLSLRPSRVLISYLGYPSTTGTSFHDYIIADDIVIPEEDSEFFSESIQYLPCYYHLVDDEHAISSRFDSKSSVGLPENAFIFCSHSAKYKITPNMFKLWASILNQVENSVLWLAHSSNFSKNNILKNLGNLGITKERVYFANYLTNKEDHLNRLQFADLILDPTPYNGHTTTNDALYAGTPVLTLKGNHFASRVSESVLCRLGLDDLVANSPDQYIQKAISLSNNPTKLKSYKSKITRNKSVFNLENLVDNLENLYVKVIEKERSTTIKA